MARRLSLTEQGGHAARPAPSGAHAELAAADPVMAGLMKRLGRRDQATRRGGMPKPDAFGALLRIVIAQQVSAKAARAIHQRVLERFGGSPSPDELLAAGVSELRAAGLSGRKADYIGDIASRITTGELDLERLSELPDEEVIGELVRLRGLGRWSAEVFLIFHLERADVLAADDLGLRRAVQLEYGLGRIPTSSQVSRIAERWRPNRTLASIYLWESLASAPG